MGFSEFELQQMQARLAHNSGREPKPDQFEPSNEPESKLHDQIIEHCKSKGWYYVHNRMDRPTTTAIGVPDFVLALPGGVTWWVEVKRKGNKPTREQAAVGVMLGHLNHKHATVYSFEEFLAVVK
jgi:hypothetical protein